MKLQRIFKKLCALIVPFLLFLGLLGDGTWALPNFGVVPVRPPRKAHVFSLVNAQGKTVSLKDFKGKPVILNFWASWCAPCLKEMPDLNKLYERYKDSDLVLLGIATDTREKPILRSIEKYQIQFPVLLDLSSKTARRYGARALPTTYFIDRNGDISGIVRGAREWNTKAAFAWMDSLLGKAAAKSAKLDPGQTSSAPLRNKARSEAKGIQSLVMGPKQGLKPGDAFPVQIRVKWKGKPGDYEFEPPEIMESPDELELLTLGSSSFQDGEVNVIDYDIYYVLGKEIKPGKYQIGPFKHYVYHNEKHGSHTSKAIEILVAGNSKFSFYLIGASGCLLLVLFGITIIFLRKKKIAKQLKGNSESFMDLLAIEKALQEADRLRVTGTPCEFYEKLLEIASQCSKEGPKEEFHETLRLRFEESRYGQKSLESWQLEEDYKRMKQKLDVLQDLVSS